MKETEPIKILITGKHSACTKKTELKTTYVHSFLLLPSQALTNQGLSFMRKYSLIWTKGLSLKLWIPDESCSHVQRWINQSLHRASICIRETTVSSYSTWRKSCFFSGICCDCIYTTVKRHICKCVYVQYERTQTSASHCVGDSGVRVSCAITSKIWLPVKGRQRAHTLTHTHTDTGLQIQTQTVCGSLCSSL